MNAYKSIALLSVLALPVFGQSLTVRNDSRSTVVVQTATLSQGKLRSDRPIILAAGAISSAIALEGDKMITVYDSRSNRILTQELHRDTKKSVALSIQSDPRTPGKIRLVPIPSDQRNP
ncbi:MAG: hypothetical protein EBV06_01115 [Planctomycetia bacterium]|nr:hypothetical protein [Planctomycetia bacterium]